MRTPPTTSDETPGLSKSISGKGDHRLVPRESAETFRALMENRGTSETNSAVVDSEQKREVESSELRVRSPESESFSATDLTQPQEHQQLSLATLQNAAHKNVSIPAAVNNAALIDLIEKHVRQLMISEGGLSYRPTSKIILRLTKHTLAETDLHLSRTDSGWRLQANARSADAFRAIEEFTPDLAERFVDQSLGTIEVEAELGIEAQHRDNPR